MQGATPARPAADAEPDTPATAEAPPLGSTRLQLQRDAAALEERVGTIHEQIYALEAEVMTASAKLAQVHEALAACAASSSSRVEQDMREQARSLAHALGYPSPRDWQVAAAASVASGNNTMVVYPAGGGKTLCATLLAALLTGKVTMMIVPILALANELGALAPARCPVCLPT